VRTFASEGGYRLLYAALGDMPQALGLNPRFSRPRPYRLPRMLVEQA